MNPTAKISFFALGGAIALVGLAYINDARAMDAARAKCLAQDTPQSCECIISIIDNELSFLTGMPIFGRFFEPSPSRLKAVEAHAQSVC